MVLREHFAGSVAPLTDPCQWQVPHHQPKPSLPGFGCHQLPAGPEQLRLGNTAGARIPHQPEHVLIQNAVVKWEIGTVDPSQPQGLTTMLPEAANGLPVGTESRGSIVIPHRWQKGNALSTHWQEDRAGKGLPHLVQFAGAEALFLARHHVAGADHQGWVQR